MDFELKNLNVLIGGNGAGKTNLIDFFRMLRKIMEGKLNDYIINSGGISDLLFNGRKTTSVMEFETHFGIRGYRFKLESGPAENAILKDEARYYKYGTFGWWELGDSADGHSLLKKEANNEEDANSKYSRPVFSAIMSWQVYHFHDTSESAPMRHYEIIQDNKVLRYNASNIAPYLLHLKNEHKETYNEILESIRIVNPFFNDFLLDVMSFGEKQKVNLSWRQKGSDYPMQPYHFSDGTIRFICLVTALLQPNPPSTIIFDEPELGLHPYAVEILAELIKSASQRMQVIVSTQAPALVDCFSLEDIIVVNRENGESTFKRMDEQEFSSWLEEYSLGDLWRKNIIAGSHVHE